MNKAELAKEIVKESQYNLSQNIAEDMINCFMKTVKKEVAKGNPVQLIGFGTFTFSKRQGRVCKNPQTGEEMTVPACKVPKFKAGKTFKEALNK